MTNRKATAGKGSVKASERGKKKVSKPVAGPPAPSIFGLKPVTVV